MIEEGKTYNIVVDYEDETGLLRNSFVAQTAVEITRIAFGKEEKKITKLSFASDESEQKFMSVSMLADVPIPRLTPDKRKWYVNFTKQAVKMLVNKFAMSGNFNEVSFQHTDKIIKGVFLVESFILEKGRVESPLFPEATEGSWVTTYWIKDKELYEELKNSEEFTGFSIEIDAWLEEQFSKIQLSFDSISDEDSDKLFLEMKEIWESNLSEELRVDIILSKLKVK